MQNPNCKKLKGIEVHISTNIYGSFQWNMSVFDCLVGERFSQDIMPKHKLNLCFAVMPRLKKRRGKGGIRTRKLNKPVMLK